VNVLLTGVCAFVPGASAGTSKDVIGALMCCSIVTPTGYAGRIVQQERAARRHS
jgi:hypothetical protein